MRTRVAVAEQVTEREAIGLDEGFFQQVFVADRLPEFLPALPPDQAEAMVLDQFRLQTLGYAQEFPHASRRVVLWRGRPVGRVIDADHGTHLSLIDIVIDPDHRGLGIGTVVVERLQDRARDAQCSLCLQALIGSPAVRLYESLGFRTLGTNGNRVQMEWTP